MYLRPLTCVSYINSCRVRESDEETPGVPTTTTPINLSLEGTLVKNGHNTIDLEDRIDV